MQTKILIVEDEAITAMDVKNRLENLDFEIVGIASRGQEAIQKTEEFKPDLVLMDIILKGDMDGIEAATEIQEHFDIPVIYLTAFSDEKTLDRVKLTKPYGFITKPINQYGLEGTIKTAIYKHTLDKKLEESEKKLKNAYKLLEKKVKKRTFELEETLAKLKESENQFKTLADNLPDLIIRVDKDLKCIYMNSNIVQFTGKKPDFFIGKTLDESEIPSEFTQRWKEAYHNAFNKREIQYNELQIPTINKILKLETITVPEFNDKNEIISAITVIRNVINQKKKKI